MLTVISSDLRSVTSLNLVIRFPVFPTARASSTAASTSAVILISSAVALMLPTSVFKTKVALLILFTYSLTASVASALLIPPTLTVPILTPSDITALLVFAAFVTSLPVNRTNDITAIPKQKEIFFILLFIMISSFTLPISCLASYFIIIT